jgi:hypothetical protein
VVGGVVNQREHQELEVARVTLDEQEVVRGVHRELVLASQRVGEQGSELPHQAHHVDFAGAGLAGLAPGQKGPGDPGAAAELVQHRLTRLDHQRVVLAVLQQRVRLPEQGGEGVVERVSCTHGEPPDGLEPRGLLREQAPLARIDRYVARFHDRVIGGRGRN